MALIASDGLLVPAGQVFTLSGTMGGSKIGRSNLIQDDSQLYGIDLLDLFIHNSTSRAVLPTTAAADDLGFIKTGDFTDPATVQSIDFKATTTTAYAAFEFWLPPEYESAETIAVRIHAAMNTTVSDGTCNLDLELHKADTEGASGSDICATAQQDMNSLTWADFDFTITATGLIGGDQLLGRIKITGTDSATGTAVIGEIGAVWMVLDIKG